MINYYFNIKLIETLNFKYDCNHLKENVINNFSLSLNIKNFDNLDDSINYYFSDELIENENLILCDICKIKLPAIKILKIHYLPKILVITLNRFEYNKDLNIKVKINKYFSFPFKLDLKRFLFNEDNINNNCSDCNLYYQPLLFIKVRVIMDTIFLS